MPTRRNRKRGGGWFNTPKKVLRSYPGSGYNNNYSGSFPPTNTQEVSTNNPIKGYTYNNNHTGSFPPSNGEYWRQPKPEVSKYKSLINRFARGTTRKNAFGRGPNAQIASKIRNNNIHKASKIKGLRTNRLF